MRVLSSFPFYLLIFLFIIFPFGVLVRISPLANVNIYPTDIVSVFWLLLFLTFYLKKLNYLKKLFVAAVIFNVIAVLSLIVNSSSYSFEELAVAASYLLRFDAYLSLLFIGLGSFKRSEKELLKKFFLASSILLVVFGFVQYFFYNNLRNLYYLGWDDHLYRLFSTFLDPNFAGLFFSVFAVFLLGLIVMKKPSKLWLFYIFVFTANILALILTYSRSAMIAFMAGMFYVLFSYRKFKILFVILVLTLATFFALSDSLVENRNPFRIASSEARLDSARKAWEIFSEKPILGVGFNAYRYAQINKGFVDPAKTLLSNADAGTDNSFLFVLAAGGILGFAAYLNIWRVVFNISKRSMNFRVALAIVSTLFVSALFINALFYVPLMLWVFVYFGLFVFSKD